MIYIFLNVNFLNIIYSNKIINIKAFFLNMYSLTSKYRKQNKYNCDLCMVFLVLGNYSYQLLNFLNWMTINMELLKLINSYIFNSMYA